METAKECCSQIERQISVNIRSEREICARNIKDVYYCLFIIFKCKKKNLHYVKAWLKPDFSLNISKISTNILVPNHALSKTNFIQLHIILMIILFSNIKTWKIYIKMVFFYTIPGQLKLQNYNISIHLGLSFFNLLFSAEGIRNEIYIAHVARFIYKEIYT